MRKLFLLLLMLGGLSFASVKDTTAVKLNLKAVRLNGPVNIDGILSEDVWNSGNGHNTLIQRDPNEGKLPTEKTEVYFAYDNEALYVAARLFDSSPDSIIARLGRRDVFQNSDMFYFFIDPYLDHQTGYYFAINAAGTLYDGVLFNNDWDDNSWDGVWQGKVSRDNNGWNVEMKIPYSQLRFHKKDEYVWGVNVKRTIQRKNESDYFVYTPRSASGFVSRFPELRGIEKISPPGRIEVLPYIVTKAEYLQHSSSDPFNDGSRYSPGIGADIKGGLGSNLTLNATVNPDFGQVEVDPAVVNLSDVETFFNEKRPFFVEGSSIFNFGIGGANNYWGFNWASPEMFYSRRIGRSPQGELPDHDYMRQSEGAHILGAAKITGKIGQNWNVGTVNALTSRENADYSVNGLKSSAEVEPLSYYGVYRAQRDFNDGKQGFGFMSTYTHRFFKDVRLKDEINGNAAMFGLDGWTFLDDDKEWVFTGWAAGSHVAGTREKITSLQKNSLHYFQRPDADYLGVDTNKTSLTGYAARFYVNKQKGNFFFNSAFGVVDPGFDVNDIGFMWRTDVINWHIGGGYSWNKPTNWYRSAELGGAVFSNSDYGNNVTWRGLFHFGSFQFLNYYFTNWSLAYNPETVNNRRTRGGPLSLNPSGMEANFYISTDSRRDWVFDFSYNTYQSKANKSISYSVGVEWRPVANVSVSLSPSISFNNYAAQWVDAIDDPFAASTFGKRYIMADMEQTEFSAAVRLNWTFTPNLSLQLYAQPLISAGEYSNYKELARPKSFDFLVYGENNSTIEADPSDGSVFNVDPDGAQGPAAPFSIDNMNYNFISLRGNAVLRWEYKPGSTVYLVWTQSRANDGQDGNFNFSRSYDRMFSARPDNIFMLKFNYWLNM